MLIQIEKRVRRPYIDMATDRPSLPERAAGFTKRG
jgi:hypothetical protein